MRKPRGQGIRSKVFCHEGSLFHSVGEYRIGYKLQIGHWSSARSGEIKRSRRQPAGIYFENLESLRARRDQNGGPRLSQTKHMTRI